MTVEDVTHATLRVREFLQDAVSDPGEVTASSLVPLVINVMSLVQGVTGLTGPERKAVVLSAITGYIGDEIQDPTRSDLLVFVRLSLPAVIDGLVDVANSAPVFGRETSCCAAS